MAFSYYRQLTPRQKRVYRQSDGIASVLLPGDDRIGPRVASVDRALRLEDRERTEAACGELLAVLSERLRVPPVRVTVLAKRPSRSWGELHGLYEPVEGRSPARITVWMRTAHRRQVVAFRTFLRTLLHELGHHLDYELFKLADSFHTEGFFRRESSLLHQLLRHSPNVGPDDNKRG
jgi:hypothetical protein